MADNTTLPGTGDVIATDDIGGVKVQRVKPGFGADGSYTDVSPVAPMPVTVDTGALVQAVDGLVLTLSRLLMGAAGQYPDASGRTRVSIDAGILPTVTTVTTVTTVSTVTKLSQIGSAGLDASLMAVAQSNTAAIALRGCITVS